MVVRIHPWLPKVPYRDQQREAQWKRERYDLLKRLMREAKSRPCTDCKIEYPYYVMQFDHRDPRQKLIKLAYIGGMSLSIKKLEEEIAKCDVVCANCHAARTWQQRNGLVQRVAPLPCKERD